MVAGGPPGGDVFRGLTGVTWLRHWDKETDGTDRSVRPLDRPQAQQDSTAAHVLERILMDFRPVE